MQGTSLSKWRTCQLNADGIPGCHGESCVQGFKRDPDNSTCVDIDECAEDPDICIKEEGTLCMNYEGGHYCMENPDAAIGNNTIPITNEDADENGCDQGFKWIPERKVCEDEDECEIEPPICFSYETCHNRDGSFDCIPIQCEDGEKIEDGKCVAVDSCANGFRYNPIIDECEDIDECSEVTGVCETGSICENTEGSFKCKKDKCDPGYKMQKGGWFGQAECRDIDECAEKSHNCSAETVCTNTEGSFRCDCGHGFHEINGTCEDVNECTETINPCSEMTSRCKNTIGSYTCECLKGFEPIGTNSCSDIDECKMEEVCPQYSRCMNELGTHRCDCNHGWTMKPDNSSCLPPKNMECRGHLANPDDEDQRRCTCPPGFEAKFNAGVMTCDDIDECLSITDHQCPEGSGTKCFNTYGSNQCVSQRCQDGYTWEDDKNWCFNNRFKDKKCSLDLGHCFKNYIEPVTISHKFLSLRSNESASDDKPIILYQMTGLEKSQYNFTFEKSDFSVTFPDKIEFHEFKADFENDFKLEADFKHPDGTISRNRATLSLIKPLLGPQDIKITIDTSLNTSNIQINKQKEQWMKSLHKTVIHMFVSKYDGIHF